MTCPNENDNCSIQEQLDKKRKEDLKTRPKIVKYFLGYRSAAWQRQYESSKDLKC